MKPPPRQQRDDEEACAHAEGARQRCAPAPKGQSFSGASIGRHPGASTRDRVQMEASRVKLLLRLLLLAGACDGYKPVVIVHGILDGPKQFETLRLFITKTHPGTPVEVIDLYDNMASLDPLWKQVQGFSKAIEPIMRQAPDGIHLLCFSQGGLICRALLSVIPDHNVDAFISLSAPLAGQYGDTDYLKSVFPSCMKKIVFKICYRTVRPQVSICDYWNDPHHRLLYLQRNSFLPILNGETPHNHTEEWRQNFLRIKKLVLIGGPDDGVITPWQSSHFGFYDSNENVIGMQEQEFFKSDAFGLKKLDARGDVSVCVQPGVPHTQWHSNRTVFASCMERWLT